MIGQKPRCRKWPNTGMQGRVERDQPEQVEDVGRVGRRQVLDPAVERRVPHLDRDEQHLVEREEHRHLDQDRQAAGQRIDLLLLVELHQRLLLLHLVVGVALADRGHLRLHRLHLRHRGVGLVGEREEDDLDEDGDQQDGDAEIADVVVDPVDRPEHRLGDEVEPAPVDQQIEAVEPKLLLVAVDDAATSLAPANSRVRGRRRWRPARWSARRRDSRSDRASACRRWLEENCAWMVALVSGISVAAQYLSVNAEPGVGRLERDVLLVLDRLVGELLQALVAEHADQAFVQDVVAERLRRAVAARSARTDRASTGARALVVDLVFDGEQILVVDRDDAAEFAALRRCPRSA